MVSIHGRDSGGFGYDGDSYDDGQGPGVRGFVEPVSRWVQYAGAATSVAMILGVLVWGYKLAVRDVSGVPVIRALEGPARIAPEDPGGDLARHVGLSVNEVAGKGIAAAGPERVVLAPSAGELSAEDTAMTGVRSLVKVDAGNEVDELAEAEPARAPVPVVPRGEALAVQGEALPVESPEAAEGAAAAQLRVAAAAARQKPVARTVPVIPETAQRSVEEVVTGPGVTQSPRPVARPARKAQAQQATAKPAAVPRADVAEVDPSTLPEGTRVVQIGAFDTADIARGEWDRVAARFETLMVGKRRIVQEAVSAGRPFYRLRVEGFKSVDDSRRFCAALVAEGVNCIPTAAR